MPDFDTPIPRRGTWSEKWDQAAEGEIPLWVADMDFAAPEPVLAALRARLDHGVLGYPHVAQEILDVVAGYQLRAHGWAVDPAWIIPLPGLVCGLHLCARAVVDPGQGILTTTPIYPPFLSAPADLGRRVDRLDLSPDDGWRLHEAALAQAGRADTRSLWLCQPHNPTGRVFDADEVAAVAAVAEARDWVVVSDEIWADLILDDGVPHRPFAAHSPQAAARSITLTAPSKTWNLPGLGCSFAIIPDATLRRRVRTAMGRQLPDVNILGLVAAVAAYREGGPWLADCRAYLRGNRDRVSAWMAERPRLRFAPGAATYLAWFDASASGDHLARRCHEAGVFLSDGTYFGRPGWLRLNFACPRRVLEEGLRRLATVFPA